MLLEQRTHLDLLERVLLGTSFFRYRVRTVSMMVRNYCKLLSCSIFAMLCTFMMKFCHSETHYEALLLVHE